MEPKTIKNALAFLSRVDLKGAEAREMVKVEDMLNNMLKAFSNPQPRPQSPEVTKLGKPKKTVAEQVEPKPDDGKEKQGEEAPAA